MLEEMGTALGTTWFKMLTVCTVGMMEFRGAEKTKPAVGKEELVAPTSSGTCVAPGLEVPARLEAAARPWSWWGDEPVWRR